MLSKILILIIFTTSSVFAKNLGVWGAVFPIEEQDIKEFIYSRLNQMKQNGDLEKIKNFFIKNVKKHILRPTPEPNITITAEPKIFYYDPTYILTKDILDEKNRVIAKAGTTINPLNTITMHSVWLFFNADDKDQVRWALENAKKYNYVKYILVRGNIKDAGNILKQRIYFDQKGLITKQLGIAHVPCIAKQVGKKIQIQEAHV